MLPRHIALLVNTDFESRSDQSAHSGPRGFEADRAVLDTAQAVAGALDALGVEVAQLSISSTVDGLIEELATRRIDTVFNLVESIDNDYGREWEVPALLARHGLRYTGNGPDALRVCRAKDEVREICQRAGVRVAHGQLLASASELTPARLASVRYPCFVKPAQVDGSIGIDRDSLCCDAAALRAQVERLLRALPGPLLVEDYLPGKEINVSLFPEPRRGYVVATEIDFSEVPAELPRVVTYDCKWTPESPEYAAKTVPAALTEELRAEVEALARRTFLALGGGGYGRVDMRLDAQGRPAVIDVNPNNDLHPEAGLALAARSVGVGYAALIGSILAHAEGAEA